MFEKRLRVTEQPFDEIEYDSYDGVIGVIINIFAERNEN